MTFYKGVASGTQGLGATWSFSQHMTAALSLSAAASAFDTAVSAYWTAATAHHAPAVALVKTTMYEIDPATGNSVGVQITGNSKVGTGATAALPFDVALCASKETTTPGRTGRGRLFLPPLVAGDLSNGHVAAAAVTAMVAAVKAMYDSLIGAGFTLNLYGRKSHVIFNLSGFHIDDKFDVQSNRSNKYVPTRTSSAL